MWLGALILATINFYPAFDNSFRSADFVLLHAIVHGKALDAAFTPAIDLPYFRPGVMGTFWMEFTLFRFAGGWYIVFNFLLHVVNAWLLLLVLRELRLTPTAATVGSSLFLVGFGHYGKQILWACTSGLILSVTMLLAILLLGARWLRSNYGTDAHRLSGAARVNGVLIVCLLFIAPASSEIGLIPPVVLLAFALAHYGIRVVRNAALLVPVLLPVVLWVIASVFVFGYSGAYQDRFPVGLHGVDNFCRYLGLMFLPVQVPYDSSTVGSYLSLLRLATAFHYLLGSLAVAGSVVLLIKGSPTLRFLVIWVYAAVIPFSFLRLEGSWLELRYLYTAALPANALIGYGVALVFSSNKRRARALTVSCIVVACVGTLALVRYLEHKYDREAKQRKNVVTLQVLENTWRERSLLP